MHKITQHVEGAATETGVTTRDKAGNNPGHTEGLPTRQPRPALQMVELATRHVEPV
jgi:hypothetical protein